MKKIDSKSKYICPFCGGTKTLPYVRHGISQNCTECDKDGKISGSKVITLGIEDFITDKSLTTLKP